MAAAAATCQLRWTNETDECFGDGPPVSGLLPPEPPSYESAARQVARVPAAELTVEALYHEFARPGLPVVIDGALGLNAIDATADALLDGDAFDALPARPPAALAVGARIVHLV